MQTATDLRNLLARIDRKGYPAYKDTKGAYQFPDYVLSIDHVQGDPFAAPSKVEHPCERKAAGLPPALYPNPCQRIALQDALTRQFGRRAARASFQAKGSGHSGLISVSRCGQEVLERTACCPGPAARRSAACGWRWASPPTGAPSTPGSWKRSSSTCCPGASRPVPALPQPGRQSGSRPWLIWRRTSSISAGSCPAPAGPVRLCGRRQHPAPDLRRLLPAHEAGRPLPLPPESCRSPWTCPTGGHITGMGIPKGITLIVGGGYHGKSTLLKALELGVYDHIAGDGREYVITDRTAVKIRAEDGRSIRNTDISMFISNLPNGKDTAAFLHRGRQRQHLPGGQRGGELWRPGPPCFSWTRTPAPPTSWSGTQLMQRVIHRDMEPITPFIDRIRKPCTGTRASPPSWWLAAPGPTSTRLTASSRWTGTSPGTSPSGQSRRPWLSPRTGQPPKSTGLPNLDRRPKSLASNSGAAIGWKLKALGRDGVSIQRETIDLRYVEQLADGEQTAALGVLLVCTPSGTCLDGKAHPAAKWWMSWTG